jgi:hypothetical protein
MCTGAEPALIASLAGAAVSTVGVIQQGQAAKKQGKLQSAFLLQQAESERQAAAARESDFRKSQSRAMAARRAALGASGVVQSTGSPLLASEDFAGEVELQALRIREGGEVSATRLQQQAALSRLQGSQAQTGALLRGGSLLVTAAGKAF